MALESLPLALTIASVAFGLLLVSGLVWLIPVYIQKQKSKTRKKEMQKKVNEELVRNIRYRSPSTVSTFPQNSKINDYGATQMRQLEKSERESFIVPIEEKTEVPSIAITCEDELTEGAVSESETQFKVSDGVLDKISLINSKRRFSSIVFTHSDELKVLSEDANLNTGEEKKERRASMSLFETCKLACPELTQNMGQSTEHLNQLVLSDSESYGKLYFMLSQPDNDNKSLECVVIKITDIVNMKKKHYQLQMELFVENSKLIYSNQTDIQTCVGEVVNFDESFTVDIDGKVQFNDSNENFVLVFTLVQFDSKKIKSQKFGVIRFDLLGLIDGQILSMNGQEQFVICRNFITLTEKEKFKERSGNALVFLRFSKLCPLNFVIGVMEVKDIASSKPYSGLSVRITLASEGKVLDSRKSKVIKKKYQTEDGIFKVDESFEFNLSLQKSIIKDNSKSLAKFTSQDTFVTLFLCGRNNIGFSHVIGKCVLGPIQFADGTGLLHWQKGNNNLGEIVYQWHYLKN